MDFEVSNGLFGRWRDEIDKVHRLLVGVLVFADPVLEFGVMHPVHAAPRSLGLAAPLPLLDERDYLLAACFTLLLWLPLKVGKSHGSENLGQTSEPHLLRSRRP